MRTFTVELRERNYPKFEGRYNAYVGVYGQLSGEYLGAIEQPLAMDIDESNVSDLLLTAEKFVQSNNNPVSIW